VLIERQALEAESPPRIWIPRSRRDLAISAASLVALVLAMTYGWHWWTMET
jgi:hypothetical protein